MGIEFNTQDMLDTYLFENTQLLENLQEIVLEQKDEEYFDEDNAYDKGIISDNDV